jgi:tetratricopeptide (TPR) repeat protein
MTADPIRPASASFRIACLNGAVCLGAALAPMLSMARDTNAPIAEAVHRGGLTCDQAQPVIPESIQRLQGFVSASVVARMEIAVPGKPRRVDIEVSSGFADLDRAVEAALMRISCRSDEGGPETTAHATQEFHFDLSGAGTIPSGPESARLLVGRGNYWSRRQDLDRALADYDEAIRRDPQLSLAYFHRAILHFRRQHLDEAISDLNHILDDGRTDAAASRLRARIEVRRQDIAGAVRDFQVVRSITRQPSDDIELGYALFATGEYVRSSAAFSSARAGGSSNKYIFIWRFLAQALEGDGSAARRVLEQDRSGIKDGTWPMPVIDFYLGKTSQEQLLAATRNAEGSSPRGRLCEAKFYIAERALADTGFAQARSWLQDAARECPPTFHESTAAVAQLARLCGPADECAAGVETAPEASATWCEPHPPATEPSAARQTHFVQSGWARLSMDVHPGAVPVTNVRVVSEAGGAGVGPYLLKRTRTWVGCATNQEERHIEILELGSDIAQSPANEGFGLYAFKPKYASPRLPGGSMNIGVCPVAATLQLRQPEAPNIIVNLESEGGTEVKAWLETLVPDREYLAVNPRGNRVVFDCYVRNDELVFFAR